MASGIINVADPFSLKSSLSSQASTISSQTTSLKHLIVERKRLNGLTISPNSTMYKSFSVAKSGYTPLGIIAFQVKNSESGGIYESFCHVYCCYLSGTTVYMSARNRNTTSYTAKVDYIVDVLYK